MANKTLEAIGDISTTVSTTAKATNMFIQQSAGFACDIPKRARGGFNKTADLLAKSVELLDIELDFQLSKSKSDNALDLAILEQSNEIIMADTKAIADIAKARAKSRLEEYQPSKTLDF